MNYRYTLPFAGALALAGIGLSALWSKTQSVDPAVTAAYDGNLRELRRLDRTLNQDVLRARFRLINTYDPLVASRKGIESAQLAIAAVPTFLSPSDADRLESEIGAYQATLAEKARRVETFKSRNSVLKNSLRYVPTLAAEVAAAADDEAPTIGIGDEVRALLGQVLVYNLTSDEGLAPEMRAAADRIDASGQLLQPDTRRKLGMLLAHVDTILRTKPEVDGTIRAIFDTPVATREDAVAVAYAQGTADAETVATRWRMGLYGACVGLMGLVAYASHRLNRALGALAEANATLEQKVTDRTAALHDRNQAMRLVLDNVEQGFVTVDRSGVFAAERSARLDQWVPPADVGERPSVWAWIGAADPRAASWYELGWSDLVAETLPFEVLAAQLPRRMKLGERHLGLELRPLRQGGAIYAVLLVVTDVTERVARERAEAEGKDLLRVLEHVMTDRGGFMSFMQESERMVKRVVGGVGGQAQTFRDVHTLKGNAGIFGITTVATVCGEIETELVEQTCELSLDHRSRIDRVWHTFEDKIEPVLGKATADGVELTWREYQELLSAARSGSGARELERLLSWLALEPTERPFRRIARQVHTLGEKLGKGPIAVQVQANGLRLDRERYAPFWSSLVHVLRNAVDHGLEADADERAQRGKAMGGNIWLSSRMEGATAIVEVRDDGRGIDWEGLARKAAARGLPCAGREGLLDALFADGVSTREDVSEISGRGVGLSAVRGVVEELGGRIEVASTPGEGTSFRFFLPTGGVQELTAAA